MEGSVLDLGPEVELDPAVVEKALQKVRSRGERRKTQRRAGVSGALVLALVATIVVGADLSGSRKPSTTNPTQVAAPPKTAAPSTSSPEATETSVALSLAAQVTQTAANALANLKSISATEEVVTHKLSFRDYVNFDGNRTVQYRMLADGSYWQNVTDRVDGRTDTQTEAYSPVSGKTTNCLPAQAGAPATCNVSWSTGGPSSELITFVSAVSDAPKARNQAATETVYRDAKSWTLEYDTTAFASEQSEHVKLIIDQKSGMPVRLETIVAGKPDTEVSLTDLVVNPSLESSQLQVAIPKNARVDDSTKMSSRETGQAPSVFGAKPAGYAAGIPVATIDGFSTKEVWSTAAARGACTPGLYGDLGPSIEQISRQGFLAYYAFTTDTSRCRGTLSPSQIMRDFANSKKVKTVVASGGVMRGTSFDIYAQPDHSLFIYGKGKHYYTYATGELTLDDAETLINSYAQ